MMATTIMSSIKVKPDCFFHLCISACFVRNRNGRLARQAFYIGKRRANK